VYYINVRTVHVVLFVIILTNKHICCAFVGLHNKLYKIHGTYIKTLPLIAEFKERNFVLPFSYSDFV